MSHDPERAEELRAVHAAGGKAAGVAKRHAKAALPDGVPKAPRSLDDASQIASWITRAVLIGEIDVRVAEAATKAVRQFQLTEEKRAMQAELKALRAQLDAAKRKSAA